MMFVEEESSDSDSAYESISVSKKTKEQATHIDENNVTSNTRSSSSEAVGYQSLCRPVALI